MTAHDPNQTQPDASGSRPPLHDLSLPPNARQQTAGPKRKSGGDGDTPSVSAKKRRADGTFGLDDDDGEREGANGAKHWTDDDKTKLFTYLMGPGQDDHFNMLRSSKNSCLREVRISCRQFVGYLWLMT